MPYKSDEDRLNYLRKYRQAHAQKRAEGRPDYDAAAHANKRAAHFGVMGKLTIADIRKVLTPESRCHYCGKERSELSLVFGKQRLELDHVIPLSEGGPNHVSNLVACCHRCNVRKFAKPSAASWSRRYDRCQDCGTVERAHLSKGLCSACYQRAAVYRRGN